MNNLDSNGVGGESTRRVVIPKGAIEGIGYRVTRDERGMVNLRLGSQTHSCLEEEDGYVVLGGGEDPKVAKELSRRLQELSDLTPEEREAIIIKEWNIWRSQRDY